MIKKSRKLENAIPLSIRIKEVIKKYLESEYWNYEEVYEDIGEKIDELFNNYEVNEDYNIDIRKSHLSNRIFDIFYDNEIRYDYNLMMEIDNFIDMYYN